MTVDALTVGELARAVKSCLETAPELADVWVRGEVSNAYPASSGHWYFTLKDEDASLKCVMWKGQAVRQSVLPENGGAFLMHGNMSFYGKNGTAQLIIDLVEADGVGDFHVRYEAVKSLLLAEGLIDPERRRPLPPYPRRVGVVTSRDAAAFQDICNVVRRRWPSAEIVLAHTPVQGDPAPAGIIAALTAMAGAGVDVVIVARGGGSIEDLWAFNDEAVARAIAACPVPVVSGVGHETDSTIADFVADERAPTPSAAAERVTPDRDELRQAVDELSGRGRWLITGRLADARARLDALHHGLTLAGPVRQLAERRRQLADGRHGLTQAMAGRMALARSRLDGLATRLGALDPNAVLARGYAHVSRSSDGTVVRHLDDVKAGDGLRVRVADGAFDALVAGQPRLIDL